MRTSIEADFLVVDLGVEECYQVARFGTPVGDRNHPIFPDAKIDVWPLDLYGGPERDLVLQRGETAAQVFSNEDLSLFVPRSWIGDVRYAGARVPIAAIHSFEDPKYLDHYRALLPENGIRLRFAGTLQVFDLAAVGYSE